MQHSIHPLQRFLPLPEKKCHSTLQSFPLSILLSLPRVGFSSRSVWADEWRPTGELPSRPNHKEGLSPTARGLDESKPHIEPSSKPGDVDSPAGVSPNSAKRPRSPSPPHAQKYPIHRVPGVFPHTPTRSTREKDPKTPSSAFTPSQRQRRLEHIIAGMAESPQRRGKPSISPYVTTGYTRGEADPPTAYATASRSGRRTSVFSFQGISNGDEYDGMSQPSPSKRSRLFYKDEDENESGDGDEEDHDHGTGPLSSVGIQTSPREELFDDKSERAVEAALDFATEHSFGSVVGKSRNHVPSICDRLPAAFPHPRRPSQSRPPQCQQPMTPGYRSQGYLTPPQSSELRPVVSPLSRQGGLAPVGSPVQRNGNGRVEGGQPHPQWQFQEDAVSASHSMHTYI